MLYIMPILILAVIPWLNWQLKLAGPLDQAGGFNRFRVARTVLIGARFITVVALVGTAAYCVQFRLNIARATGGDIINMAAVDATTPVPATAATSTGDVK